MQTLIKKKNRNGYINIRQSRPQYKKKLSKTKTLYNNKRNNKKVNPPGRHNV